MNDIINNFYISRLIYIILVVLIGIAIIDNLKTKDKINIKNKINFKNININFLLRMLFLSFFLRILIEQMTLLFNVNQTTVIGPTNVFEIAMDFLATCILGPIFEEIIIRFGLYEKLSKKMNVFLAMIITSLVFAFIHWYNIYDFIFLLIVSLIWNYSYYKTNNLLYPIILHFIHNVYALTSNFISNNNFYIFLGIICFISYILLFLKQRREK